MTDKEERAKRIKKLLDSEAETHAGPAFESSTEPEKDEAPKEGTTRASPSRKTPTPPPPPIALDKDNLPLPRRVDQVDMGSTRVTPAAYEPASRQRNGAPQTRIASTPRPSQPPPKRPTISLNFMSGWGGCLARGFCVLPVCPGHPCHPRRFRPPDLLLSYCAHAPHRGRPEGPHLPIRDHPYPGPQRGTTL